MKNNQPKSKTWIWMTLIIVVSVIVYFMFFSNPTPPSSQTFSVDGVSDGAMIGANVLSLLNQIQSLHIDESLFQDPVYQSLTDYSVAIPPQPVGRQNPFAPIPGFVVTPKK